MKTRTCDLCSTTCNYNAYVVDLHPAPGSSGHGHYYTRDLCSSCAESDQKRLLC